ncbi:MAG TPA: cyclic nucleotide-binding domain-containing protein [Gaiellaceae bacterium]
MAEVQDVLARLSLFADLTPAQLESIAHRFEEEVFPEGERVLRRNLTGSGLFVILDGEAVVRIGDQEVTRFGPGEFFGEISLLTSEPPNADIVAMTLLRCLVIPGPDFQPFLLEHPRVLYRMLQAEARRLRDTTEWKTS